MKKPANRSWQVVQEHGCTAALLVNHRQELLQTIGDGERYLNAAFDSMNSDLYGQLRPEFRIRVAGMLPQVFMTQTPLSCQRLPVAGPAGMRYVTITMTPVQGLSAQGMLTLIQFDEERLVIANENDWSRNLMHS